MGAVFEDIIKNKEQLIMYILNLIEGKEAKTKVNLDEIELKFGKVSVKISGNLEFIVAPIKKKG
ncbi:MAG TPA: hypothetical protein ENG42_00165 [Candidatus Aenigmarchaeota archaeon]|nr:MAG: hypothetical protein DRP03_03200 [Candidatus Aenigmarchaeota archaeon]HDD45864.1 hypothetical protein [Candidatus Aenigmarchaeota archaeon]